MPCVSLWKWMFHKRNKNGNQLILRGPASVVKLQFPVSCPASCWSLQFVPIVSHLKSTWTAFGTPRRWQASSPLTGLAPMSADACWTLDRAAEWLARRIAPAALPRCGSGMWRCQAFSGYLQRCQMREMGWRGRDRDDSLHFGTGFDLVRLGKSTKKTCIDVERAAGHLCSGTGHRPFLTLHRSGRLALLGQHQQQPVGPVSNSCPAAARAQLSSQDVVWVNWWDRITNEKRTDQWRLTLKYTLEQREQLTVKKASL